MADLSLLCVLFSLVLISQHVYHTDCAVVSYCQNSRRGEWEHRLAQLLIEVSFTVEDVVCDNVDERHYAISVRYPDSGTEVWSKLVADNTEEAFLAYVVSKFTADFITTVTQSLELSMAGAKEAVVAYVKIDSKSHLLFQQAVISPALPESVKVFQLTDKSLLPKAVQGQVNKDLHVWIVTNGEWSHISLPSPDAPYDELSHYLIGIFNKLQHPLKVAYESEETFTVFKRERFNLFVVYHRANQLNDVYMNIVDPLINIFRPHFVFITYNIDQHPLPNDINKNGPFPYIVTHKVDQKSGVHINSEYTPYTIQSLKYLLQSIVDVHVNNAEVREDGPGITMSRIDIKTMEAIIQHEMFLPAVIALCQEGSTDCDVIEDKMSRAMTAIGKMSERYKVVLYVAECSSVEDVTSIKVPRLPYIITKDENGQWSLHSESMVVTVFIRAIQDIGRQFGEEHSVSSSKESNLDNYYDSFDELKEDDDFAIKFPDYLIIPHTLPILTSDNYTDFISQETTRDCLVAFYVPYCLKCKPMIYHLINATDQMKEAGMSPAVVNCANYPDVCEAFDVVQYPTIKYRKGASDLLTYKGVLSSLHLLELAYGRELRDDKDTDIREMTPSELLNILKNDGLKTLLILVAEEVTPQVASAVSGHNVYWLNSTMYPKLSEFLIGLYLLEPPVLVWADYTKRSVYRLDLKVSPTQLMVETFVTDITKGNLEPDGEIALNDWKPRSPPIMFPSDRFRSFEGNGREHFERFGNDDDEAEAIDMYPDEVVRDVNKDGSINLDKSSHRHVREEL